MMTYSLQGSTRAHFHVPRRIFGWARTVALAWTVAWGGTASSASAADYFVAPDGNDSQGDGSMGAPYGSVERAESDAGPGDTVYIRGGTYAFTGSGTLGFRLSKSGQSGAPISYFAYAGETPVFDLSGLSPSNRVTGIDLQANWIHLRGLEVTGVHQYMSGQDSWGVRVRGNSNVLETLNVHHNDAPGVFITSGADNLVLNCDSHHNFDYLEGGGSGDGFGCHSSGSGNILRGCRAWENSDDGYDFINAAGSCLVEQSISFRNGWEPDTNTAAGNGAGFKAGGYGSPPNTPAGGAATHTVQQCVSFSNRSQGYYANHHPGRIHFTNNLSFSNATNYDMLADSGYPSDHVLRNNVTLAPGGTGVSRLTGGNDDNNSWTLAVTATTDDYLSLAQELALSPRDAEGALPFNDLARLAGGSDLIDAGVDVGLAFLGSAPDLGPFEFGETEPEAGTGGASGTGGDTGTGGDLGSGGTAAEGGSGGDGAGGLATGGASGSGGLSGAGGSPAACLPSQLECDSVCTEASSDPNHCGACGVVCALGQVCSLGVCASGCDGELTQCDQACVDLMTSTSSCGMCALPCAGGESCVMGICEAPADGTAASNSADDATGCGCSLPGRPARPFGAIIGVCGVLLLAARRRERAYFS